MNYICIKSWPARSIDVGDVIADWEYRRFPINAQKNFAMQVVSPITKGKPSITPKPVAKGIPVKETKSTNRFHAQETIHAGNLHGA